MNQDKKNYNKFKRYWKLILKDRAKLDIKNYRKVYCFKQMMCEEDIVNYLLDQSKELRDTYELYQDLLHSIKNKNPEIFTTTLDQIEQEYPNISAYMKTSVKSIRKNKWFCQVKYGPQYQFNNGPIKIITYYY